MRTRNRRRQVVIQRPLAIERGQRFVAGAAGTLVGHGCGVGVEVTVVVVTLCKGVARIAQVLAREFAMAGHGQHLRAREITESHPRNRSGCLTFQALTEQPVVDRPRQKHTNTADAVISLTEVDGVVDR